MSPIRSLHMPIKPWRPWRKEEQLDMTPPALLLELIFKLRAAIDLDGSNLIRKLLSQIL